MYLSTFHTIHAEFRTILWNIYSENAHIINVLDYSLVIFFIVYIYLTSIQVKKKEYQQHPHPLTVATLLYPMFTILTSNIIAFPF